MGLRGTLHGSNPEPITDIEVRRRNVALTPIADIGTGPYYSRRSNSGSFATFADDPPRLIGCDNRAAWKAALAGQPYHTPCGLSEKSRSW
jgi:hypothetical protein